MSKDDFCIDLDDPEIRDMINRARGLNGADDSGVREYDESMQPSRDRPKKDLPKRERSSLEKKEIDDKKKYSSPRSDDRERHSRRLENDPKRYLTVDPSSWDRRPSDRRTCVCCGKSGRPYARGLCPRCYKREYWRFRYGSGSEYFAEGGG